MSLKFITNWPVNNYPLLVQISEPTMVGSLTHISVARPQWVNSNYAQHVSILEHRPRDTYIREQKIVRKRQLLPHWRHRMSSNAAANFPNHAIIWGSEHLISDTNCSKELKLKKEESLIYNVWKSNSRSFRLSWQWRTKCSSSSTTLQDIHNRWSTFNCVTTTFNFETVWTGPKFRHSHPEFGIIDMFLVNIPCQHFVYMTGTL